MYHFEASNSKKYFFGYITWSISAILMQSFRMPWKQIVTRHISMYRPGLLVVFNLKHHIPRSGKTPNWCFMTFDILLWRVTWSFNSRRVSLTGLTMLQWSWKNSKDNLCPNNPKQLSETAPRIIRTQSSNDSHNNVQNIKITDYHWRLSSAV